MTEGIIQKVQRRILEKYYDSSEKGELTDIFITELIAEIKKQSHWMYPKYTNGQHDFMSLTAYELVGDLTE